MKTEHKYKIEKYINGECLNNKLYPEVRLPYARALTILINYREKIRYQFLIIKDIAINDLSFSYRSDKGELILIELVEDVI